MKKPTFEEDKEKTLYILQRMHDHLEKEELFPQELVDEGEIMIRHLYQWTSEDKEELGYLTALRTLLFNQLSFNRRMVKNLETLWAGNAQTLNYGRVFAGYEK